MGQWLTAFTVLSKHQLSGSELFVTLIPEDLITSDFSGHHPHMCHIHIQAGKLLHK